MAEVRDLSGNGFHNIAKGPKIEQHASGRVDAVVQSDTALLPNISRGIYVGAAGSVAVEDIEGNQQTFIGVVAGTILPVQARKILSTGTTVGNDNLKVLR